ncbi:MAG: hypothetical protein AB7I59_00865 [Geminicoccaceae bacterium]
MTRMLPSRLGLLVATSLAAPAVADEPSAPADRWTVTAAPYLWAARLDGDAKVGGIEADVDVSFQDTLENLRVAGMVLVEARKGRFGFAVNPLFVRTESDARSGPLEADNTTDIATMGASVFYRAVDWEFNRTSTGEPQTLALEPLVGARLNHLRGEIDTRLDAFGRTARRQVDESQTWVDPIVGVNAILRLSEHWGVRAEADIGGFGVGSDLTWNAQAVVTYGFTVAGYDAFAAAGYRALYWDYKDGGFEWDVTMSGPMLGAGVRF